MSRTLKSVRFAEFVKQPSWVRGKSRSRGLIAKGHRFETLLGYHLADTFGSVRCSVGPWIRYIDQAGKECFAQPDFIITLPTGGKLIVEAKLTQCLTGDAQLAQLYLPLLRAMYSGPIWLVQSFQNIVYSGRSELNNLKEITNLPVESILDYQYIPPLNAKIKRTKKK